jgi:shikimate dehydrogenase
MDMKVDGASRLMIIVGDPIAQVKSPAGMTAALQGAGVNAVVMPVHVTSADLSAVLDGFSLVKNMDAIIVTVPHKFACYRHCATATLRAHALEAVNIMRRNADGSWHGEMFDGLGFLGGARMGGGDPAGKRALMIGAGGAGSAIGLAILDAGASHLDIHDADPARRDVLIARLSLAHPGKIGIGSPDPRGYQFITNATPAGMRPEDPYPVDVEGLDSTMFTGCVITAPAVSPWIAQARARGCASSVGIDMYTAEQQMMLDFLLHDAA